MGDHADALRAEYDRHIMGGRLERAEQIKDELGELGESLPEGAPEPTDEGSGHVGEPESAEEPAAAPEAPQIETASAPAPPENTAAPRASDAG